MTVIGQGLTSAGFPGISIKNAGNEETTEKTLSATLTLIPESLCSYLEHKRSP